MTTPTSPVPPTDLDRPVREGVAAMNAYLAARSATPQLDCWMRMAVEHPDCCSTAASYPTWSPEMGCIALAPAVPVTPERAA